MEQVHDATCVTDWFPVGLFRSIPWKWPREWVRVTEWDAVGPPFVMAKKDESAVELGRKGGHKRARMLTPARRSEIARQAALARWRKNGKKK